MTPNDFFLMLVQASLWNHRLHGGPIDHASLRHLMEVSDRQAVRGLVCNSLAKLSKDVVLSNVDAFEIYQSLQLIGQHNTKLFRALASLVHLLDDSDIPFVVVKGQTIEALYPLRHLRVPGDIDFYISKKYFDRAKKLIFKTWNVTYDAGDGNMHFEFMHEGVVFEMHFVLIVFSSRKIQRRFNVLLDNVTCLRRDIDGVSIPVFTPEFEILYTFLHLYHHFMELGIGVRHLCDFAVLCHQHRSLHLNTDILKDELDQLGFRQAFTAFEFVCVQALDLKESELPLEISSHDRKYGKSILQQIFLRGNMGFYGKKYRSRSGLAYNIEAFKIKIFSRIRFFWFSPRENLNVIIHEIPAKIKKSLKN